MKIPTQHTQTNVAAVAAKRVIAAAVLPIARLQRADCRLDTRMPTPGLAEFHGRLTVLPFRLHMARLGQAGLSHQIRQFGLILGRVEPAVERRTPDLAVEPLLYLLHFTHQNFAVLGTARQDRVVAHEARTILDDQDTVAELDRLGNFAALDQLGLRLKEAEELLVIADRHLDENTSPRLITGMNRPVDEVEELGPELFHRLRRRARADRDQGGIEQLPRPGDDPVGHVEEVPVGGLKPLAEVASLACSDPVDGAEMPLHNLAEVAVLTPAGLAQKAGQASGCADDGAQAAADEAGIGRVVDVGGHHERVAPDCLGRLGDKAMPLGNDQVVEPLDRVGREQTDVVAEASPVERLVVAPTVDTQDSSQRTMLLGEVLEPIVVEVAAQPYGAEDQDRPVGHSRSALIGTAGPIDVLGDCIEQFSPELGPAVDVLQASEDGDDLIAAIGVESDIRDDRTIEPKLGVEGSSHRSAPRRLPDSSSKTADFWRNPSGSLRSSRSVSGENQGKTRFKHVFRRTPARGSAVEASPPAETPGAD